MALRDTHWNEWVNVLQINPDAASREDVARLAAELFEANQKLALIAADRAGLVEALADNDELLEIGRKTIEDELIKWRDERLSMFNRGNGLVVREKDGKDSSIIRFGPETALKIGLKAIAKAKIDSALKEMGK
jgi:hypothetical protein